jgi:lipoprotein-anchoring transpeptidase ErfK/SrfK
VNKRILLVAGIILGILVIVLVISRMIHVNRAETLLKTEDESKIEKASREEKELFDAARASYGSGDLLSARGAYQKIMEKFSGSVNIRKAQSALEDINIKIMASSIPTPDSVSYEVIEGDTLARIAKKFSTTQDLIMKSNGLKNAAVVPLGRKLKIHNEKMSIVIDKSMNILTLKSQDKIVKTYRVATGVNNCTPIGNFKIINKIINPPWYTTGGVIPPDNPKNILGSRWLGLSVQGYGIHGTTEPRSLGNQVTSGCVRMKNSEVEELYSLVPEGTEVVIVD